MNNQLLENNMPQDGSEQPQNVFESAKKSKIPNWISLVVLGVVVLVAGGAVWRGLTPEKPTQDTRITCQQDSDCVLVSKYQGCCNDCNVEAVNIETKNRDEEARNKQYYCSLKKFACPQYKCAASANKQAICEQNRCVVKEKQNIQTKLQEFEVKQIADAYAEAQGYNLSEYQAPEIVNSKIGEWHLFYDQVYLSDSKTGELMGAPGKHFSVYIDDTTGEVLRLMPGE